MKCIFCGKEVSDFKGALANHQNYCKNNPNRIIFTRHAISEETKKKISESMKKAFKEGRATGWHKRKAGTKSYPEEWFEKVIQNEFDDKDFISELHVGKYRLDFAWVKKMRYIEIDGSQHSFRKESDKKKDDFCKELGWQCLRLDWSYICNNSKEAIKIAKDFIDNGKVSEIIWVSKKDQKKEELKNLRKQGRVNSLGRATSACHSPKVWEDRKQLILESGIDLTKFGWLTKVMKVTKLTKRQVYLTIEKFDIPVYKVIRNK